MKKILAILALATGTAFAADYASVDVENVTGRKGDVENVTGRKGASNSTAQYVRAGKEIPDQLGDMIQEAINTSNPAFVNDIEHWAASL